MSDILAGGLSLGLALSAHSFGSGWNEVHPFVRYDHGRMAAGAYLNSENRVSAFLAVTGGQGACWWEVGAVTGYSAVSVLPMARAGCEIAPGVSFFVAPAATAKGDVGAVAGIELKISH